MAEPGELQLILNKTSSEILNLEVRDFDDWNSWGMWQDDKYIVFLRTEIELKEWAKIVLDNVDKIYIENGEIGYKEKWISDV